jgi:uncharacterized membrane protein
MLTKGERRERKRWKKRYGMRVRGRSIFTIQEVLEGRAEIAKKKIAKRRKERNEDR